jgi:hypothetical protein
MLRVVIVVLLDLAEKFGVNELLTISVICFLERAVKHLTQGSVT